MFPIHIAVKNKLEPVLCKQILAKDPHAAEKKDNDGDLPLHVATRDGSFDLVKAILEVAPRLAEIATEEDGLPLHVAARHSAPAAVTRLLLQTYPDGVRKEVRIARFPNPSTHCLPIQDVNHFLFQKQDSEGELPLHAVCAALGSDDLMDETSEAENENDKRDFENAKVLYDHFPEGAFHTDSRGKIPAERLPMYDVHRMLSRDVFGGDTWRGEGWRVVAAGDAAHGAGGARSNAGVTGNGGNRSGAPNVPSTTANQSSYTQHPNPHASGAALLVRYGLAAFPNPTHTVLPIVQSTLFVHTSPNTRLTLYFMYRKSRGERKRGRGDERERDRAPGRGGGKSEGRAWQGNLAAAV